MAILTMSAGAGICLTMVCILNVYIYIYTVFNVCSCI